MSRAGHGLGFQRRNMQAASDAGDTSPLLQYAMIAAADPKAPAEFRAMGPTVWAVQFALVTGSLYVVDPLSLREGEGLDEYWYSGFNPLYWPVKEKYHSARDWIFNDDSGPSFWDSWHWV